MYIYLGGYACGGSIIDTRHVLTACHCLYNYEGVMHKPEETFVYTGAHHRPGGRCGEQIGQRFGVEEFITLGTYDMKTFSHDLAILRLVNTGVSHLFIILVQTKRRYSAEWLRKANPSACPPHKQDPSHCPGDGVGWGVPS